MEEGMPPTQVLIIAGSDSGAGAGIQADLKSVHANGAYALTAITAITAQNTVAVTHAYDLPTDVIRAQIDALYDDFEIAAVKTGMLSSTAIVETVAASIGERHAANVVVDPVMVSKSGFPLLQDDAVDAVRKALIPLARVATPNRFEAERLADHEIESRDDMFRAGRRILELGPGAVVIKGGHFEAAPATDFLFVENEVIELKGQLIETENTHGTGCTFASALAARLARGDDVVDATRAAKAYVTGAIRHALPIGRGHGPTDHFWKTE
jgi:hydroxymethylpyrimidine/phosphomethylpyrimidine kinase